MHEQDLVNSIQSGGKAVVLILGIAVIALIILDFRESE